jgi:programmed cell death 6-interacting protein
MHLQVKSWHFHAAAEFRKSSECISQNKYGEEIARLQVAQEYIKKGLDQNRHLREAVIKDLEVLILHIEQSFFLSLFLVIINFCFFSIVCTDSCAIKS